MAPRRQYDVFIAHASEDKQTVVRPLARLLDSHGLRVWMDEYALSLGDSLRESIDRGLARSRFGLVVLSPAFFQKTWPQKELNALVSREATHGKVLLPVWHNLDAAQIAERSPLLADRLAVTTADGLAHVALEIYRTVMAERPKRTGAKQKPVKAGPDWFGERKPLTPSLRLRTGIFRFEREARPPQPRVTGRGVPGTIQMPDNWHAKQVEESLSTNDLFYQLWDGQLSPTILEVVVDNTDVAVGLADSSIRLTVEIYPDDALPLLPSYGNWFRSRARGYWSLTSVENAPPKEKWRLPSPLDQAEERSGPDVILRMAIVTPAASSLVRFRSKEVQLTLTIEGHHFLPITASWSIASVW